MPIGRNIHALHHKSPLDYIALHPVMTVLSYIIVWLVFGFHATPFAVGLSIGYIVYALMHTMFHYNRFEKGFLHRLNLHHDMHHKFANYNFGISTNFWDRLFKTEYLTIKK